MIFYTNIKKDKIVLDIEETGCKSFDELIKEGWEIVKIKTAFRKFYALDKSEPEGYYVWSLENNVDDYLNGALNGVCLLSEENLKKAMKYLRKLARKDLMQAADKAKELEGKNE